MFPVPRRCIRIFGSPRNYTPNYEGFLQALKPQDKGRVDRAVKESLANKTGQSIEYEIVHPNGDLRTISCTWEVLLDDEGLPARLFGACQDVTDVRRAQEEDFARQKLESVGTLAGGIAHDFNNILGGVLAQTELALADLGAGMSAEEELNGIRDAALRGSEIVRQLMIYAGRETAAAGPVDLSKTVEEMLGLLKVSVTKHAVMKADLGLDLPATRASAAQIRQIVMNLITNASDAIGDRHGVIRVVTRRETLIEDSTASAGTLPVGDYLILEVSDTGRGIPPEIQANVFDPFLPPNPRGTASASLLSKGSFVVSAAPLISRASLATVLRFEYRCPVRKPRRS